MKTKPVEALTVPEPDKELTEALERVRQTLGGDVGLFFEKLRKTRNRDPSLIDLEDPRNLLSAEALARCARR